MLSNAQLYVVLICCVCVLHRDYVSAHSQSLEMSAVLEVEQKEKGLRRRSSFGFGGNVSLRKGSVLNNTFTAAVSGSYSNPSSVNGATSLNSSNKVKILVTNSENKYCSD